jgi:hypothetical protein
MDLWFGIRLPDCTAKCVIKKNRQTSTFSGMCTYLCESLYDPGLKLYLFDLPSVAHPDAGWKNDPQKFEKSKTNSCFEVLDVLL